MPIYLNGTFVEPAEAKISVMDRGLLFGDSVYEVMRAFEGVPIDLDWHIERFRHSLSESGITGWDPAEMGPLSVEMLRRNGTPNANLYWQATRGQARKRAHLPEAGLRPNVFGFADAMPSLPEAAAEMRNITAILRPDLRWKRCDIKSNGLLPNVMGKMEAQGAGADEIIMHRDGFITEGAAANIFIVKGGKVFTSADRQPVSILHGVTRRVVLEMLKAAPVFERPISIDEFETADEVLATSVTLLVGNVSHVDGRPIGTGKPGPFGTLLHRAMIEAIRRQISMQASAALAASA